MFRALAVLALVCTGGAAPVPAGAREDGGWAEVPIDWGGHVKLRSAGGWVGEDNLLAVVPGGEDDVLVDVADEGRLRLRVGPFGPDRRWSLDVHAEAVLRAGDRVDAGQRLERMLAAGIGGADGTGGIGGPRASAGAFTGSLGGGTPVEDDRRLFDLTSVHEGSGYRLTTRIDRLVLSWRPDWGSVRMGRQALTLGNGLLFNPMDLFNPFSPSDVERDYKVGDDMVSVQVGDVAGGELQLLGVPRRDPGSGDLEWDRSSVAAKLHRLLPGGSGVAVDLLAAEHYGETVLGVGATGTLGGAAWRTDVVWTDLEEATGPIDGGDFVTAVANLDRAWFWFGRNWYGWVEAYYQGLGEPEAAEALDDPALLERLARGELFTLGRLYADAAVQVELHPLLQSRLTALHNLDDHSGLLQPRLVWSAEQDLEIILGADIPYGGRGSELGGLPLSALTGTSGPLPVFGPADPVVASPARVYLWASWYF